MDAPLPLDACNPADLTVLAQLPPGLLAETAAFAHKYGFPLAVWLELASDVETMGGYWRARRETETG